MINFYVPLIVCGSRNTRSKEIQILQSGKVRSIYSWLRIELDKVGCNRINQVAGNIGRDAKRRSIEIRISWTRISCQIVERNSICPDCAWTDAAITCRV